VEGAPDGNGYVKRICRKLQVNSKFQARYEARRLRLINHLL
jgi:hypothetical protein